MVGSRNGPALAGDTDDLDPVEIAIGSGAPQRVGRFKFFLDGQRWEWSDAVARMHGYEPGTVQPTTELLLTHKHPEDREHVATVLERVLTGEPFSSRHRITDTAGRVRMMIVAGDVMRDESGTAIGTTGFYIDVTDTVQSEVSSVVTAVTASRAEIEQAKGVLMAAYGISADQAFDLLVWRSQETNIKVRELAANFLDSVNGAVSADTRTAIDHALLTAK